MRWQGGVVGEEDLGKAGEEVGEKSGGVGVDGCRYLLDEEGVYS